MVMTDEVTDEPFQFDVADLACVTTAVKLHPQSANSKCTGRGRKPAPVPSIMQLNFPDVVVKSLKSETRGRGRGRPTLPELDAFQIRPGIDTQTFGINYEKTSLTSAPNVEKCLENSLVRRIVSQKSVLSTAKERFKSYDVLKRNPAKNNAEHVDINSVEQFPELSSTNPQISSTNVKISDTETAQSEVKSSEQTPFTLLEESTPTADAANDKSSSDHAVAQELDQLFSHSIAEETDFFSGVLPSLPWMPCSTPNHVKSELSFSADVSKEADNSQDKIQNQENSAHFVRFENLPAHLTQQELKDVISPYGQILHMDFELQISGGREKLSANVKLMDDSTAQFLASCLNGSESIFEGIHGPVKCYIE
ncbi:uncharacterized protein [Watersipora subatra]|uniref:uncharacterized protein n=1 Tax=Watersipora subatra TaxID=2589382 RepID=UPI00355B26A7